MRFLSITLIIVFGALALQGFHMALVEGAWHQLWVAIPSVIMTIGLTIYNLRE